MTTTLHHNKMSPAPGRTVLALLAALGWLVGCSNDAQAPHRESLSEPYLRDFVGRRGVLLGRQS